jgi:hypothetical protein
MKLPGGVDVDERGLARFGLGPVEPPVRVGH